MSGKRALLMLFVVAIVVLNGGDCISPLLADQQSTDCCARGTCSPAQNEDPCCQTTSPSTAKYFQPAAKVTFDQSLHVVTDAPIEVARFEHLLAGSRRKYLDLSTKSPPGIAKGLSLPLLI